MSSPQPPRPPGIGRALVAGLGLLVFLWVLFVAGAIAWHYGLEVITWATHSR